MKAQEGEASLAYWLMPAEPARSFFVSTIRELAARFGGPVFEPHLTIYVTSNNNDNPSDVLNRALRNISVPCLGIRDLRYSDIFTKSLFVQFESNPVIS